jgi:mannose-6-phosphate isomerase-like protein (cupin superfamily)
MDQDSGPTLKVVRLADAMARIEECWAPRVAGTVNGHQIKLARLRGEFVWHSHEAEDEAFLVLKGRLRMRLRDGDRILEPGDLLVVPRGVEHCPVAEDEAEVLLFEPASTTNTGTAGGERTRDAVPLT